MHPAPRSAPVCQTNFIKVCVLLFLIALHVFALFRHQLNNTISRTVL